MIIQCEVPEGFYCSIQPVTEAWELLLLIGGLFIVVMVILSWVLNHE